MTTTPKVTHEFVNDLPILMYLMRDVLQYDEALDQTVARHGNWEGLSIGQVLVTWLMHIVSEHNHFMSHAQAWSHQMSKTLGGLWDQALRPTDLTDDRLAEVARALSDAAVWEKLEGRVTQRMVRVYALPPERVRLDSTTVTVYGGDEMSVLFQRGHSKDHRPDLRQFKVMLASLDPLGALIGVDVVAGNTADDGLYVPLIKRLQTTVATTGLLYIGDCKMTALGTRGYVQATQNWYLGPLAQTGRVPADLTQWVGDALKGKRALTEIRDDDGTRVGDGYEIRRRLAVETEAGRTAWTERVLIVRSDSFAQAAVRRLHQRLAHAERALTALTPPPAQGRRQYVEEAPLQMAVEEILRKHEVQGLLKVVLKPEVSRHSVRAYGASPAREVETVRYVVKVQRQQAHINAQEKILGWRAYVTNAPATRLSLSKALQAYRDEWLVERNCNRLKGRSLSLHPVWVSREDHAVGLTRLLTLAARVLALAEHQVRRKLAEENRTLAHLYAGQPTRRTQVPTTERLLKAFDHIVLTLFEKANEIHYLVTPLSEVQRVIVEDLGCPKSLYTQWIPKSWKPLKI